LKVDSGLAPDDTSDDVLIEIIITLEADRHSVGQRSVFRLLEFSVEQGIRLARLLPHLLEVSLTLCKVGIDFVAMREVKSDRAVTCSRVNRGNERAIDSGEAPRRKA